MLDLSNFFPQFLENYSESISVIEDFFLSFRTIKQGIFAMFLTLEIVCHLVTFGFTN